MTDFYSVSVRKTLEVVKSKVNGLTKEEALKRLSRKGLNKLEEKRPIGSFSILIEQFKSPLIYILLIAGAISLLLGEYIDAGVIIGSVLINTIIGFFQENKANNALSKLREMVEHKALVIRDGIEMEIDSSEVVVGDVIELTAGNNIVADARVIESLGLRINESTLTGESVSVVKSIDKVEAGASLGDRVNMVYAGTYITNGKGKAVVVATSNKTEIGKISRLVKETKEEKTPLQKRLSLMSKKIGIAVAFLCAAVIIIGVIQGRDFFEMFIISVALAVASIPEGLVVAVTVILILGMQNILKEKALTRKLVAAETLGSTTVICTDKTGTLTKGEMSVYNIVIPGKEMTIDALKESEEKDIKTATLALKIGFLCNDAFIEKDDELKESRAIGNPTEGALLEAAMEFGCCDREKLLKEEKRVAEIPFSSETKFMTTFHKKGSSYILYEKGAAEKLLEKSINYYHNGGISEITKSAREKLTKDYNNLTKRGLRVIGLATRNVKKEEWDKADGDLASLDQGLTFVGFIALKDPLRATTKETIALCKKAGIRPVIITGDHKLTATAIAEEIGINVSNGRVIEGDKLDKLSDAKLRVLVKKINVYARVSPNHKLRIVQALRANGEIVAMTGDGVNDAPALKAADIGICLGSGTDISKQTSDIILLDNNFSVIVAAVRQGRIIFNNIRKVITYLISDSFTEVLLIVGSIIIGTPLAILPTQILWVNIVGDGLPALALPFEKKDNDDVLNKKPIDKKEPIINKEMKIIILAAGLSRDFIIFGIYLYLIRNNYEIGYIRTLVFAMIGVDSLLYAFSLRSLVKPIWKMNIFNNVHLIFGVAISFLLMLLAIYWAPLQLMLSTVPLDFNSWLLIIGMGIISIMMIETVKHFFITKKELHAKKFTV